uniref:Translational activator of cytochrome c oxidase 1 n=2 Tax=Arion vulgaris TaxID=1028688 RepID=A0A0B7ABD9_9EUPU
MKMTSRCLVNFHKYLGIKNFSVWHGKLVPLLNTSASSSSIRLHHFARSVRCFNLDTESALQINCIRQINSSSFLEAGHSKWQNIKHVKAAADREKGMKSNLLSRKLQFIFAKNPEIDPKLNTELANLIKWARSNNLSNDVMNKAIDRQVKLQDPKCISAFGGRGPSNTGVIIECFALKPHHTKSIIQSIVKKYGFNLNASVDDLFEYKGIIDVELSSEESAAARSDSETFPLDKYIEMAIEVGAEEVTLEDDGEKPYLQFICNPLEVPKVVKGLSAAGLSIVNNEKIYIPKVVVPVTSEFLEVVDKLTDKLDLNPDVIKYHFNVVPES